MNRFYLVSFVVLLTACAGYKELPVEYDYSYKGNFKKYRTFDLMKPLGLDDSTMMNDVIEKSIAARMRFLGYKKTGTRPHLVISFKMFADSLRFNGYEQPELETWMRSRKDDLTYEKKKFHMRTGTLLIQFY